MQRLASKFRDSVSGELLKEFSLKNSLSVPRPTSVVVNVGLGIAKDDEKILDLVAADIKTITGQHPNVRRARKAEAGFKIRAGDPIGLAVTLRGDRMWSFLDKLFNVVLPRVRDFRGLSEKSFDRQGNFSFGIVDYSVFPEIDPNKVTKARGFGVTVVTSAKNYDQSRSLLTKLGLPLRKKLGRGQ